MSERLIQCGNHSWAPWSAVCIHLMDGSANTAVGLHSNNEEVLYDWICSDCFEKFSVGDKTDEFLMDNLRAVCMHCTRKLIQPYQDREAVILPEGEE